MTDFQYRPASAPGQHYQISITPFRKRNPSAPDGRLAGGGGLHRGRPHPPSWKLRPPTCAWSSKWPSGSAHEIGNAVVPISTHQQLLRERVNDPDFQQSLAAAMDEGVKRVSRLVDQMRFLARDRMERVESVPVKQLIEEAFREARAYHPSTTVLLQYESSGEPLSVSCDRQGLQHAFAEIILNALQANTPSCQVQVRARAGDRFQPARAGRGSKCRTAGRVSAPRRRARPPSRFSPRAKSGWASAWP